MVFVICVTLQVLTRYIPFISLYWTGDVAKYSFIWAVFMGAAVMVSKSSHFSMTFIIEKFPPLILKICNLFNQLLIFVFGVMMTFYGYSLTLSFWGWSFQSLPLLDQQYLWAAVPVCGATIAIYSLFNMYELLRNPPEEGESDMVTKLLEAEQYEVSNDFKR